MKRTVQMAKGNITVKRNRKGYKPPSAHSDRFHLTFIPFGDREGGYFVQAPLISVRSLAGVGGVRLRRHGRLV